MNNEKVLLTSIFLIFFILLGILMSVMIKKDLNLEENYKRKMQEGNFKNPPDNSWPKVKIEVRK